MDQELLGKLLQKNQERHQRRVEEFRRRQEERKVSIMKTILTEEDHYVSRRQIRQLKPKQAPVKREPSKLHLRDYEDYDLTLNSRLAEEGEAVAEESDDDDQDKKASKPLHKSQTTLHAASFVRRQLPIIKTVSTTPALERSPVKEFRKLDIDREIDDVLRMMDSIAEVDGQLYQNKRNSNLPEEIAPDNDMGIPMRTKPMFTTVHRPHMTAMSTTKRDKNGLAEDERVLPGGIRIGRDHGIKRKANLAPPLIITPQFLITPRKLMQFRDVLPTQPYQQHFQLLNQSRRTSGFRIQLSPVEMGTWCQLICSSAGRLPPGASVEGTIKVRFDHDEWDQLDQMDSKFGWLRVWGENGVVSECKIECVSPKFIPRLSCSVDDPLRFGKVVVGDQAQVQLRVSNDGAVPSKFRILACDDSTVSSLQFCLLSKAANEKTSNNDKDNLDINMIEASIDQSSSLQVASGLLKAYCTQIINISLRPRTEPGLLSVNYVIEFQPIVMERSDGSTQHNNNNNNNLYNHQQQSLSLAFSADLIASNLSLSPTVNRHFRIEAEIVPLPIAVSQQHLSFKCVPIGRWYRNMVLLHNLEQSAQRFQITCSSLQRTVKAGYSIFHVPGYGHVEVSPDNGFVQINEPFPVWFKLRPDELCGDGQLDLTFHLYSGRNAMSVPIRLTATLTDHRFTVDRCQLDFGQCWVGMGYRQSIQIQSLSRLPMQLAVVDGLFLVQSQPSSQLQQHAEPLSISPNDGFTELPAGCKQTLTFNYLPSDTGPMDRWITISNTSGQQEKIRLTASVRRPPIALADHPGNIINFNRVCFGSRAFAKVVLIGQAFGQAYFEWPADLKQFLGKDTVDLLIDPRSGVLQKGEQTTVLFKYSPRQPANELPSPAVGSISNTSDTSSSNNSSPVAAAAGSLHSVGGTTNTTNNYNGVDLDSLALDLEIPCYVRREESTQAYDTVIMVRVKATPLMPVYDIVEPPKNHQEIQFDICPINESITSRLSIKNCRDRRLTLKLSPLDPLGAFEMRSGNITIEPKGLLSIPIRFRPREAGQFTEYLDIETQDDRCNTRIKIIGEAALPSFEIDPPSLHHHIGETLLNRPIRKSFSIQNTSQFPVLCTLISISSPLFSTTLSSTEIKVGQRLEIMVDFDARTAGFIEAELVISMQHQKQSVKLRLTALCYQHTIYASAFDQVQPFSPEFGLAGSVQGSLEGFKQRLLLGAPPPMPTQQISQEATAANGLQQQMGVLQQQQQQQYLQQQLALQLPFPYQQSGRLQKVAPRTYYVTKFVEWIKLDPIKIGELAASAEDGQQLVDADLAQELNKYAQPAPPPLTASQHQRKNTAMQAALGKQRRAASVVYIPLYRLAGDCIRLNNRLLSEGADGSFQQSSSSQQPSGSFTVQLLDRRDCDPKDLQWVDAQRIIRGDAQQQQQQLMFSLDQKSGQLEPGASVPLKIHLRNQKGDYLDGNAGKRQTVTALSQPEYVEAVFKITLQGGSELLDGGDIGDGQQRVIFLRIQTKQ